MKNLKLKAARILNDLSQQQLAEAANVSRHTIIQLERGKANVAVNTAIKIAERLGLTVEELFNNKQKH